MDAKLQVEMTFSSSCSNCKRSIYVMDHLEDPEFLIMYSKKPLEVKCTCGFTETITWSGEIDQEPVTLLIDLN